ncbi:FtsW/RodA/SpoVE family cell cycle protein [Bartonella sp. DGB1]|uniref:FtsW/RodA/SpoVE family cell cycle protein n=1 Tax=Bartonella sp. DGB1 TaxID=3239807 RepID=UPI0035249124
MVLKVKQGGFLFKWWRTVDRSLLVIALLLIMVGLILSFASTPAIAKKYSLPYYYFVIRHVIYLLIALSIMIAISFLSVENICKLSFLLFFFSILLLLLTLFNGIEIKGAKRWLAFAGVSLQPSEFMKPFYIICSAFLMIYAVKYNNLTLKILMFVSLLVVATLLILQPDYGQMILIFLIWSIMYFLSGASLILIMPLVGILATITMIAYFYVSHFRNRIISFITGEGNNFQTELAIDAIKKGGWFGVGPGEGKIKNILPDSYTDFIFVVAAEEFGIIFCIIILLLYLVLFVRLIYLSMQQSDLFKRLAIAGLALLLILQALVNISVNVNLIPSKGMTLTLISYGGSSLIASAIAIGLLLGLTRKYPKIFFYNR